MDFKDLMDTSKNNRERFEELVNYGKDRIIPMFGAGVSCAVGYPSWKKLLKNVVEKESEKADVEKLLSEGKYEDAASFAQKKVGKRAFFDYIKNTFSIENMKKLDSCYISELPDVFTGIMATTNYDKVIETSYINRKKAITTYLPMDEYQYEAIEEHLHQGTNCLLKLHGSVDVTDSIIFSKEHYDKYYGFDGINTSLSMPKTLNQAIAGRAFLFLGCSLQGDRLLKLFENHNYATHFALLELPKKEDERIDRERQLRNNYGIKVIWYPNNREDKYDALAVLIRELKSRWFPQNLSDDALINAHQERLKNEMIFPWADSSINWRTAYPKLFVEPTLESLNTRKIISKKQLIEDYYDSNIIITGIAGAGKSTLLKQIYLFENTNNHFLYIHISSFSNTEDPWEKAIANIINNKNGSLKPVTLLIDGVDESPFSEAELADIITKLSSLHNVHFWLASRDDFYKRIKSIIDMRNYTDVIKVLPWNNGEAKVFIDKYTSIINKKDIKETILQDGNKDDLKEIFQNPFETALLTFIVEEGDFKFNEELSNRFVLYEHFFQCWIKREVHRKTSNGEVNSIADELYYASVQIYKGKKATVTTKDTAVTGLLIPYGKTARFENEYKLFYHRSFCAFFIARKIQHCFINNSEQLLQLFSQPLKNDVTDFVNNSFHTMNIEEINQVKNNLFLLYKYVLYPYKQFTPISVREYIIKMSDREKLCNKDELLYFLMRLPGVSVNQEIRYANRHTKEPLLKLNIAYGATLHNENRITLSYAKKLKPGTKEDLVNRSWTITYFSDVIADPLNYEDIEKKPWDNSRIARMNRLKDASFKSIRFRIFDIPLLICFYDSRSWIDVTEEDFETIKKCDIGSNKYTTKEKYFLKKKKEELVNKCEQALLKNKL